LKKGARRGGDDPDLGNIHQPRDLGQSFRFCREAGFMGIEKDGLPAEPYPEGSEEKSGEKQEKRSEGTPFQADFSMLRYRGREKKLFQKADAEG